MKTLLTKSINRAASFIQQGHVVAFPTETVYGLGADAFDAKAVAKIFMAKGRPSDNPLIVHLASIEDLPLVTTDVPDTAKKLFDHFSPGPITIILKKNNAIPAIVSAGLKTVGTRIPALKVARDFIRASERPLAAPSANRSGRPSGTQYKHVLDDFEGRIPCILKGAASQYGLESTVVDCSTTKPKILRLGAIGSAEIEAVLGVGLTERRIRKLKTIKSPGMKYKHYAPRAKVIIFDPKEKLKRGGGAKAYIGMTNPQKNTFEKIKICKSLQSYGQELYSFFRDCDTSHMTHIYCEMPPYSGIGMTITDRILKASQKK